MNISPALRAKYGMFNTCDRIDAAHGDRVLVADARTSMSDYRIALAQALGKRCDRNGFTS